MKEEIRDAVFDAMEVSLDAQLRAVRRLRQPAPEPGTKARKGMSQVDMAYDILKRAHAPLHISQLIDRIHSSFGVAVDRESLVSALTKKVARSDRFLRTDKNTFAVRAEVPR
jgi:hypothetical protein